MPEFAQGLVEIAPDLFVEFDGYWLRILDRSSMSELRDVHLDPERAKAFFDWCRREELIA